MGFPDQCGGTSWRHSFGQVRNADAHGSVAQIEPERFRRAFQEQSDECLKNRGPV